jgi:hypothetical protein
MRYDYCMRTTLDIDADILGVAKSIANQKEISIGRALSELARKGLQTNEPEVIRNGFRLIPRPPGQVPYITLEMVNALRDDEDGE